MTLAAGSLGLDENGQIEKPKRLGQQHVSCRNNEL
jgi:hypothetical protein